MWFLCLFLFSLQPDLYSHSILANAECLLHVACVISFRYSVKIVTNRRFNFRNKICIVFEACSSCNQLTIATCSDFLWNPERISSRSFAKYSRENLGMGSLIILFLFTKLSVRTRSPLSRPASMDAKEKKCGQSERIFQPCVQCTFSFERLSWHGVATAKRWDNKLQVPGIEFTFS